MEVKEIWFDMEKVEKKWNTLFHIASDKFDKPIELKIWYEDAELKGFMDKIQIQNEVIGDLNKKLTKQQEEKSELERQLKQVKEELKQREKDIHLLDEALVSQKKEINDLYKLISDVKQTSETLSGTMLSLQWNMKLLEKKTTKQPSVFSDKTFISWHERVMLGFVDVPNGDYVVISKFVVGEHNEYVENQDDIIFEKVHIEDWYMPSYQLVWGTDVDNPTATIYWDLVLIPC